MWADRNIGLHIEAGNDDPRLLCIYLDCICYILRNVGGICVIVYAYVLSDAQQFLHNHSNSHIQSMPKRYHQYPVSVSLPVSGVQGNIWSDNSVKTYDHI